MTHDLVLKNGRVIDPAQGLDEITDVAFANGKVAAVGKGLEGAESVDCTGRLVVPGLLDLHTHVWYGGIYIGVSPDPVARKSGTTTLIDAGSAGSGNFHGLRDLANEAGSILGPLFPVLLELDDVSTDQPVADGEADVG